MSPNSVQPFAHLKLTPFSYLGVSIFFILSNPRSRLPNTFLVEPAPFGVTGARLEGVANQSTGPGLEGVWSSLSPASIDLEGERTGVFLSSSFLEDFCRRGVSQGVAKFSLSSPSFFSSSSCFCWSWTNNIKPVLRFRSL